VLGTSGALGASGAVSCLLQPETIARTANVATRDKRFFIRGKAWVNLTASTRFYFPIKCRAAMSRA